MTDSPPSPLSRQLPAIVLTLSVAAACGGRVEPGSLDDRQVPLGHGLSGGNTSVGSGGSSAFGAGGQLAGTGAVGGDGSTGGAAPGTGGAAIGAGGSVLPGAGGQPIVVSSSSCESPIETGSAVNVGYTGTLEQSDRGIYFGSCGGDGQEAAFRFTAPEDGRYAFDTRGSGFDTVLNVVNRDCYGITVACNDDTFELESEVSVDLYGGQVVMVLVESYEGNSGDFALNVVQQSGSSRDCGVDIGRSLATPLIAQPVSIPDTTGVLVNDCGASEPVATYRWQAPYSDWYVFSTLGSAFDTVITLRDGCGGDEIMCNDDNNNNADTTSRLSYYFNEGESILIEISSFNGSGTFQAGPAYLELSIEAE